MDDDREDSAKLRSGDHRPHGRVGRYGERLTLPQGGGAIEIESVDDQKPARYCCSRTIRVPVMVG